MHEHVFIMTTEIAQNYPEAWGDEDKRVAGAIARLGELKARGVDTIVDLTVIGLGRYIPRIARVAAATELNIVVATGLYTYNDVPFYFHYLGPGAQLDGPEIMTDMFVRDIEHGIADTGIKAGILKCATDEPGLTPGVERVLRAVAQAHKRTGAPISTHTHAGLRRGLDQQRIFAEEGVDLSRVVIGHCGDSTDVGYLEELIAAGSYLGMDRFGVDVISPFQDRVNIVARMCERGHADKMVLSHDACCYFDALPEELVPVAMPNWHYLHIHNDVIPALKQHGVTDEQLHTMLVDNPAPHLRAAGRLSVRQPRRANAMGLALCIYIGSLLIYTPIHGETSRRHRRAGFKHGSYRIGHDDDQRHRQRGPAASHVSASSTRRRRSRHAGRRTARGPRRSMALKYLLDTSVIKRLSRPAVRRAVEPLAEAGAVARTQITDLEVGYSARNETEWQRLMVALSAFDLIESTASHHRRALGIQRLLAARSQRGRKIPDLLIAAAGEEHGLVVLHYDADFDLIAAVTGQPCQWIVPAGTID